jgi:acetoacetate decarboxylase
MAIKFEADADAVRASLPKPLELSKDEPTTCMLWFGDWLVIPAENPDLLVRHPDRCMYTEAQLIVRCSYKGTEGICPRYLWVDTDVAMLSGNFMGFPKKLGYTHLSYNKSKIFGLIKDREPFGAGTRIGARTFSHAEGLMYGAITLDRPMEEADFGQYPFLMIVHFPTLDVEATKPMAHQLVGIPDEEVTGVGERWIGKDAELEFYPSELEEHMMLAPKRIIGSYYQELGLRHNGIRVLYDFLK